MAGIGEGLGALMQGFASIYVPRQLAMKERELREKEMAQRAAERAADRADRAEERRQQNEQFLALLGERRANRAEDIKRHSTERAEDRLAERDNLFIREGLARSGRLDAFNDQVKILGIQHGYGKELQGLADSRAMLMQHINDSHALALNAQNAQERASAAAQEQKFRQDLVDQQRRENTVNHLRDRQEKIIDSLYALQEGDAQRVAGQAKIGLDMALDVAKQRSAMGLPTDENLLTRYADKFSDYLRARVNPKRAGKLMEIEADALGKALAIAQREAQQPGSVPLAEKEAAMKAVADLPGTLRMYQDEEPPPSTDKKGAAKPTSYQTQLKDVMDRTGADEAAAKQILRERGVAADVDLRGEAIKLKPNSQLKEPALGQKFDEWAADHPDEFKAAFMRFESHPSLGVTNPNATDSYKVERFKDWFIEAVKHYTPYDTATSNKSKYDKSLDRRWNTALPRVLEFIGTGAATQMGGLQEMKQAAPPVKPRDLPEGTKKGMELLRDLTDPDNPPPGEGWLWQRDDTGKKYVTPPH